MTVEIRPGVERPDWSAVTSGLARAALESRDARRPSLVNAWPIGLTAREDLIGAGHWRPSQRSDGRLR